jgi:hypothetical protein
VVAAGAGVPAAAVPADAGLSRTNCVRAASSAENKVLPPVPPPWTESLPGFELRSLAALLYEDRPVPQMVARLVVAVVPAIEFVDIILALGAIVRTRGIGARGGNLNAALNYWDSRHGELGIAGRRSALPARRPNVDLVEASQWHTAPIVSRPHVAYPSRMRRTKRESEAVYPGHGRRTP